MDSSNGLLIVFKALHFNCIYCGSGTSFYSNYGGAPTYEGFLRTRQDKIAASFWLANASSAWEVTSIACRSESTFLSVKTCVCVNWLFNVTINDISVIQYGSGGLEIVHKIRWEIHLNPQWKFEWKSTCTVHTFHSPVPATCIIDCVILHNLLPLCTGKHRECYLVWLDWICFILVHLEF